MVYMRGSPRDYDNWEKAGCTGWGWEQVGAAFKRIEDHELGEGEWRGKGGPLKVTIHPKKDPLCEAIIEAAGQMGVRRVDDVNDVRGVVDGCIGYQTATIWKGKRFSASRAFIDPVRRRPNLDIALETKVLKIEFEDRRAVAVRLRDAQGERAVRATREIVLSAGAIETPKLLQLSGIGPVDLLRTHGIDVLRDAPQVGRNFREHRHLDIKLRVTDGSQNKYLQGWRLIRSVLQYLLTSTGPMTNCVHEIGGFVKTDPALPHADMQFNLISVSTPPTSSLKGVVLEKEPGITLLGYYTRPKSQGEVRIRSANPDDAPYIDANHLDAEEDRQKAIATFNWLRKLATQPALKGWVVGETHPADMIKSDEDVLINAMELGTTCFHTCGTARMGADEEAIVDPRLRVRGVEGLRIADTSIMPTIVSGNTNGPAMMIGMRASDFILEDQRAA